ncbi:hypothetical protein AAFF_G00434800 [Aldrovandia affinis]|uniref:RELT-like protein 1 n=1 Tax=Aldrovandia affinis TaxID=143900 RepID=A0AAD7SAI8_9TELE|nr:hypothetical protein AAFF_G00434800 [Aldrovandia affinis]
MHDPAMAESTVMHGNPPPTKSVDTAGSTSYVAFVLVPVFFLLGLLGVLICHVLKKKGYRCTTKAEEEEEERLKRENDPEAADQNDALNDSNNDSHSDTVNQIVHYIMKNEANCDALKAMVHENSIDSDGPTTPTSPVSPTSPSPPVTPVSPGAPVGAAKHTCSHLHTVGGVGGDKNVCGRCSQKKWPLMRQGSKGRGDRRSQGLTVLAVGRFRVTKPEPKPAKERRTLIITETNGGTPPPTTEAEPLSRTNSERQVSRGEGEGEGEARRRGSRKKTTAQSDVPRDRAHFSWRGLGRCSCACDPYREVDGKISYVFNPQISKGHRGIG